MNASTSFVIISVSEKEKNRGLKHIKSLIREA